MGNEAAAENDRGRLDFGAAGKAVVLVGMAMSAYGLFGLGPILPAIAAAFPDQPNAALLTRLMVSAAGIFVAVVSPIVGQVADHVGQRRVLLTALLLYALAGCAPFFLDNLYAILIARMFHGIAIAAYGTLVLVMLVKHSVGNARERWLGYLAMFATVTSISYGSIVGYIGHAFGWRAVFLTYAVALPLLVCAVIGFPPDPPRATDVGADNHSVAQDDSRKSGQVRFAIFALLAGAALMGSAVFIPFRLREIGIADSRMIGNMMVTTSVASVVAGFIYGRFRARYSVATTFVVAFSIMAFGLSLIGIVAQAYQMIAAMLVAGFGQGLAIPNYWSLAAVTGPERYRARTMGFAKSGVYGGPLIAQLILEPAVGQTRYAVAFGALAAASAAFALYFGWQIVGGRAKIATIEQ